MKLRNILWVCLLGNESTLLLADERTVPLRSNGCNNTKKEEKHLKIEFKLQARIRYHIKLQDQKQHNICTPSTWNPVIRKRSRFSDKSFDSLLHRHLTRIWLRTMSHAYAQVEHCSSINVGNYTKQLFLFLPLVEN